MSRLGIIEAEQPQQCDLCGKIDELRPYGPNGEAVCFDCAMKDEAAAKRAFCRHVLGENSPTQRRGDDGGAVPTRPDGAE